MSYTSNKNKFVFILSEEDISIEAVVLRWLKSRREDMRDMLQNWIDAYFYRLIDWVKKEVGAAK